MYFFAVDTKIIRIDLFFVVRAIVADNTQKHVLIHNSLIFKTEQSESYFPRHPNLGNIAFLFVELSVNFELCSSFCAKQVNWLNNRLAIKSDEIPDVGEHIWLIK